VGAGAPQNNDGVTRFLNKDVLYGMDTKLMESILQQGSDKG
jgi:hypothetical protein